MSHNLALYMHDPCGDIVFSIYQILILIKRDFSVPQKAFPQFLYLLHSSRTQQFQEHKCNVCTDFINLFNKCLCNCHMPGGGIIDSGYTVVIKRDGTCVLDKETDN